MEGVFDAITRMTDALLETHYNQMRAVLDMHKEAMMMAVREKPVDKDSVRNVPIQKRKVEQEEPVYTTKKSKPIVVDSSSSSEEEEDEPVLSFDSNIEDDDEEDEDGLAPEGDPPVYDADVIDQDYIKRAVEPIRWALRKRPSSRTTPFIKQVFQDRAGRAIDITQRHADDIDEDGVDYFAPIETELSELKNFIETLRHEPDFWKAIQSSPWAERKLGDPLVSIRANLGRGDGRNQEAKDTFDKILDGEGSTTFSNPNKKGICILCGLQRNCSQRFIRPDGSIHLIGSRCAELARALFRLATYMRQDHGKLDTPKLTRIMKDIDDYMKKVMSANEDKNRLEE